MKELASCGANRGKNMPGRESSKCKGPEVEIFRHTVVTARCQVLMNRMSRVSVAGGDFSERVWESRSGGD